MWLTDPFYREVILCAQESMSTFDMVFNWLSKLYKCSPLNSVSGMKKRSTIWSMKLGSLKNREANSTLKEEGRDPIWQRAHSEYLKYGDTKTRCSFLKLV